MGKAIPVLGYPSKAAACAAMSAAGKSDDHIARALNMSKYDVRKAVDGHVRPSSFMTVRRDPVGPLTYAKPRPSSLLDEIYLAAERAQQRRMARLQQQ